MSTGTPHLYLSLFQKEIERFEEYARLRSTCDRFHVRRKHKRYHRSWPLLVAKYEDGCLHEYSAALHDASAGGIGFMSDHLFAIDETVFVKLFWHEAAGLRIPAIVRHVSPGPSGILTGTEFLVESSQACEAALTLEQIIAL